MTRREPNEEFIDLSSEEDKKNNTKKGKFTENGVTYDPYAMSKSHKLPVWLKATFTKWWVAGMIFYFMFFGFGSILYGTLFALVLGLAWGIITDIFVNHAFRNFSKDCNNYEPFIMFGRVRSLWTIPINLAYGIGLAMLSYIVIESALLIIKDRNPAANTDDILFYAGPFAFAFLMLGFDMLFVLIRNLIEKAIKKRKEN